MNIHRRRFLSMLAVAYPLSKACARSPPAKGQGANAERLKALLLGSLIGDALGGPLEFATEDVRAGRVAGCRKWNDARRLDQSTTQHLAETLVMVDYRDTRPETAPHGPWIANAPAGTLTDDSRLKVILMRALVRSQREAARPLNQSDIARALIDFQPQAGAAAEADVARLLQEGLAEYRYAAHWVLGERDLRIARPIDRLWAGVANCSGQMMLLPLAGCESGDAPRTYQRVFELDFIDAPGAKDITAAIVAGLAAAISAEADALSISKRWRLLEATIREVDPYGLADVPYVGRPLIRWLDLADSIVERADGRPKVAYHLLETEGKPVYYWDAHFTLLASLVLLKLAKYDPLASLNLAIDFGHDTDSYGQLMGAMIGAVHGASVFPKQMIQNVSQQLRAEYDDDVDAWVRVLQAASGVEYDPNHVWD